MTSPRADTSRAWDADGTSTDPAHAQHRCRGTNWSGRSQWRRHGIPEELGWAWGLRDYHENRCQITDVLGALLGGKTGIHKTEMVGKFWCEWTRRRRHKWRGKGGTYPQDEDDTMAGLMVNMAYVQCNCTIYRLDERGVDERSGSG